MTAAIPDEAKTKFARRRVPLRRYGDPEEVAHMTLSLVLPAAYGQSNQPSEGESSTGRNEAGFGGGPHCHLLVVDSAQDRFDFIQVFPSHRAHVASGTADGVFVADPDCDGLID